MGYRDAVAAEERWTKPREKIREASLPAYCQRTFESFEKLFDYRGVMALPEEQRPTFIELPAEGSPEVYFPKYDQVGPSLLTLYPRETMVASMAKVTIRRPPCRLAPCDSCSWCTVDVRSA